MSANLVVNGDAEQAVGSTDGTPVATPPWTVTGDATAVKYGVNNYPDLTDPGAPTPGLNLFVGGLNDAASSLSQTISLATYATRIDCGLVTLTLSAYLGGVGVQGDNAQVVVRFLNAGGTEIANSAHTIGPVSAADRGDVTKLLLRTGDKVVPAGARQVAVTIVLTRTGGVVNDGYADAVSVVLKGI